MREYNAQIMERENINLIDKLASQKRIVFAVLVFVGYLTMNVPIVTGEMGLAPFSFSDPDMEPAKLPAGFVNIDIKEVGGATVTTMTGPCVDGLQRVIERTDGVDTDGEKFSASADFMQPCGVGNHPDWVH